MPRHLFDSEYLFGIHEPGGENHMLEFGRPGWIVFTEGIGNDPNDKSGRDYRQWSDKGIGVIVRLNNGYHPAGTIPNSTRYADFAARCANFVAASQGCKLWIIGNEMNFAIERPPRIGPSFEQPARPGETVPSWMYWFRRHFVRDQTPLPPPAPTEKGDPFYHGYPERFNTINLPETAAPGGSPNGESSPPTPENLSSGDGEVITPEMYVKCYKLCREKIHALDSHGTDKVLVGSVAPWNNQTRYAGNELGDWVKYFRDILSLLGPELCDGFTLHTYTHGADANLVTNEDKMGAPFQNRNYHFRAYQDFMRAVPGGMRHLPCYLTETDEDVEWKDENIAWVQRAYGEINWWNRQTGNQQIMALILYRWPRIDKWYIEGKQGVINDFRDALREDYKWKRVTAPALPAVLGEQLRTMEWLNLRKTPNGDVVGQVAARSIIKVINAAPTLVDGVYWWNVEAPITTGSSQKGWMAQESSQGLTLLQRVNAGQVTPPPVTPPPVDPNTPVTGLKPGGRARTLDLARLRKSPGVTNKPADDILADIPQGTLFDVLEGPTIADALRFWKLRGSNAAGTVLTGWMAERAPNGIQLLEAVAPNGGEEEPEKEEPPTPPTPPTPPPPPVGSFKIGDRVVTLAYLRLRKTPGSAGKGEDDIIADLVPQIVGVVKAGPKSADGMIWWQVEMPVSGQPYTGWAAEATTDGVKLLGLAAEAPPPTPPTPVTGIKINDLVLARTAVNVRKTPGLVGKPADDLLGYFENRTTLNIVEGPRDLDGMRWWRVGGITLSRGEVIGWVAEKLLDGTPLIGPPDRLPGTKIPTPAENRWLGAPYAGSFGISQLWGERPWVYSRFTYDGVPLKGHNGIDFLTPTGTQLTAIDGGVVADAILGDPGGFGNYVKLTHSWGESLYAHMDSVAVTKGQTLTRGEVIGTSGNTGFSGGPHLHFAIRINPYVRGDGWGGFSDPLPYMNPTDFVLPPYVLPRASDVDPSHAEQPPAPHDFAPGIGPELPGSPRP